MPSTVLCPDCHRPAAVLGHFTTGGADDHPQAFLRIRCTGVLTLLVPAPHELVNPANAARPGR